MSRRPGGRPSLTTLLALRRARAEAARAEYGAAVSARHAAEQMLAGHLGELADHEVAGSAWQGTVDARERLRAAVTGSRARLAAAGDAERDARARWVVHRRSERAVEKLLERVAAARQGALARAEQAALDETGLVAHRRRDAAAIGGAP
ncbi:MAG: flagellar FliJ family protein [Actinomycetales bacterium]